MTISVSTGARNATLVTDSLKGNLDGGKIKLYAGTVPATADDSIGGATLLCTISESGGATGLTFEAAAASGVLAKTIAETWEGTNAATGIAAFYRWEMSGDTGASSATEIRIQGTIGAGSGDLSLSDTSLTAAANQTIDFYTITLPG